MPALASSKPAARSITPGPAVAVEGLAIEFPGRSGPVRVVDGVSFEIAPGEALGLVGESGSGKSITALALLGLLPMAGARLAAGTIRLAGEDVTDLPQAGWRRHRGSTVAMIFQDPLMALNPVYTVGDQIAEVLTVHEKLSRRAAFAKAVEMLAAVGIPDPAGRAHSYPHQLSGGMRQRVMIASALAGSPKLLIADEPTTALDVTIQAQILELIDSLKRQTGAAVLFISHDLGVISEIADRVVVMYAGGIVEEASAPSLFAAPEHPYTIGLMGSLPEMDGPGGPLVAIPGSVPRPGEAPPGCRFAPRCPFEIDPCRTPQQLRAGAPGHRVACIRAPLGAAA